MIQFGVFLVKNAGTVNVCPQSRARPEHWKTSSLYSVQWQEFILERWKSIKDDSSLEELCSNWWQQAGNESMFLFSMFEVSAISVNKSRPECTISNDLSFLWKLSFLLEFFITLLFCLFVTKTLSQKNSYYKLFWSNEFNSIKFNRCILDVIEDNKRHWFERSFFFLQFLLRMRT